jgi:hypothetical protein
MSGERKFSLIGLATLITALTAIPGVILNTYLDFRERSNTELVQESSYKNTADVIEDLSDDIDVCLLEVDKLKEEVYEMRGYIRGRMHRTSRPQIQPQSEDVEEEIVVGESTKSKRRPLVKFDDILQHVQKTGEVYAPPESVDTANDSP